jgi:mannose-6-phosphate isomerase-like protein (cupin superfamily)
VALLTPGAGPYVGAMSYPEPRYLGTGGEVTATLRRADQPAELDTATSHCHYLATGAGTKGRFGLYRWEMGPQPSGPGPHFHRTMSESFYVLAGTVRIYDGTQWLDRRPGDFVLVPEGGIHGFRNESGADASMLILFAPGAPREAYFEGLVEMGSRTARPSQEELDDFYARHDNIWV